MDFIGLGHHRRPQRSRLDRRAVVLCIGPIDRMRKPSSVGVSDACRTSTNTARRRFRRACGDSLTSDFWIVMAVALFKTYGLPPISSSIMTRSAVSRFGSVVRLIQRSNECYCIAVGTQGNGHMPFLAERASNHLRKISSHSHSVDVIDVFAALSRPTLARSDTPTRASPAFRAKKFRFFYRSRNCLPRGAGGFSGHRTLAGLGSLAGRIRPRLAARISGRELDSGQAARASPARPRVHCRCAPHGGCPDQTREGAVWGRGS